MKNHSATFLRLALISLAFALPTFVPVQAISAHRPAKQSAAPASQTHFVLTGLTDPATVAGTIFVQCPAVPRDATVSYYLDDHVISITATYPFWIGGGDVPSGYSIKAYAGGLHSLHVIATQPNGHRWRSNTVSLEVVASLNSRFSPTLRPYLNQPTAQQNSPDNLLQQLATPGAKLSAEELETRRRVLAMYLNWGTDPALDNSSDQSAHLTSLLPTAWAPASQTQPSSPWSMRFSPDAPFYQAIPKMWPRTQLPPNYIRTVQLNSSPDGDGIGFGEAVAGPSDSLQSVRSQWYDVADTLRTYQFRIPHDWAKKLPGQKEGDLHMIFINPAENTFISSYKTSASATTGGPDSLYAGPPTSFDSLGDHGGSIAANFAELPLLLQPGEAISATKPIAHALGGPVARVWAARVYPATARDANVLSSKNSCTNNGYTNTGLVPYGGVIQLDPELDLRPLHLSLPAYRILRAIQTYGYYVMDFGCTDLDIYTAIPQTELDPYGGFWGNRNGPGVQNEVQGIIAKSKLYVVVPLTKKE